MSLYSDWFYLDESFQVWNIAVGSRDGKGLDEDSLTEIFDLLFQDGKELLQLDGHFGLVVTIYQKDLFQVGPVLPHMMVGTLLNYVFDFHQKFIEGGEGIAVFEEK